MRNIEIIKKFMQHEQTMQTLQTYLQNIDEMNNMNQVSFELEVWLSSPQFG